MRLSQIISENNTTTKRTQSVYGFVGSSTAGTSKNKFFIYLGSPYKAMICINKRREKQNNISIKENYFDLLNKKQR